MRKIASFIICVFCAMNISAAAPKTHSLTSPDGKLTVKVSGNTFTVLKNGTVVIAPSRSSMVLDNGSVISVNAETSKVRIKSYDNVIVSPVYKKSEVSDHYNEMELTFPGYKVIFRAYDEAVAYRFVSTLKKPFKVVSEKTNIAMACDCDSFIPYVIGFNGSDINSQFYNSFENTYTETKISAWDPSRLAFLPLTMKNVNGYTVSITESDLHDYPGMYVINTDGDNSLEAVFAPSTKTEHQGGFIMIENIIDEYQDYLVACDAGREFPWRIINVAENDAQLLDNDMTFKLGKAPAEGSDFSWVRPGKVAWDWWNDWNIRDVDFLSGVNNETYEYYIDFAAEHGIEYVVLDEGWSVKGPADLLQVVPEIDLERLVKYGREKGVGLILWAGYWAFNRDMEGVCRHYSELGIKGFKIDFLNKDNCEMVNFCWRAAETAAKYHLLLDFHGAFKPAGLQRTFPNVLNHEGVFGLEQMKWSTESDMVRNDCTIPFTRMVAGCLDYTPGAMLNVTRENYHPCWSQPSSQGTRCHQLALYTIFESPLNMLCDSPSNYLANRECLDFIAGIPTVWDETVALGGCVGEYAVIARRKGDEWYVGAITDWTPRDLDIDLGRLFTGKRNVTIYSDGVNAHRSASDLRISKASLSGKIKVHLAPGGGWTCYISSQGKDGDTALSTHLPQ